MNNNNSQSNSQSNSSWYKILKKHLGKILIIIIIIITLVVVFWNRITKLFKSSGTQKEKPVIELLETSFGKNNNSGISNYTASDTKDFVINMKLELKNYTEFINSLQIVRYREEQTVNLADGSTINLPAMTTVHDIEGPYQKGTKNIVMKPLPDELMLGIYKFDIKFTNDSFTTPTKTGSTIDLEKITTDMIALGETEFVTINFRLVSETLDTKAEFNQGQVNLLTNDKTNIFPNMSIYFTPYGTSKKFFNIVDSANNKKLTVMSDDSVTWTPSGSSFYIVKATGTNSLIALNDGQDSTTNNPKVLYFNGTNIIFNNIDNLTGNEMENGAFMRIDLAKTKFIAVHNRGANKTATVGEIKVYDENGNNVPIIEGSEKIIGKSDPITSGKYLQMGNFAYDDVPSSYSSFAQEQDIDYQVMVWELEKPTSVSKVYMYRRSQCLDQLWCQNRTHNMNITLHKESDGSAPTGDPTHIYTLRKEIFHKDGAVDQTIPIEDFTSIDLSGDKFCVGIPRSELHYNIYERLAIDVEVLGPDKANKIFEDLSELKKVYNDGKLPLLGGPSDAMGAKYKYLFRAIGDRNPDNKSVCSGDMFMSKTLDMPTLSQYVDKKFCQYKSPSINYPTGKLFDNRCPDAPILSDHPVGTDTFVVTDLTK